MAMICEECGGIIPDMGKRNGCKNHVQRNEVYVKKWRWGELDEQ